MLRSAGHDSIVLLLLNRASCHAHLSSVNAIKGRVSSCMAY
jgi:hypothetical protein